MHYSISIQCPEEKKKDLSLQSDSGENQQELGTVKESNSRECDCNTLDTHQN